MGLLLDAWRTVASDGTQKLTLVHIGGKIQTVDAPFLPYFYAYGTEAEVVEWLDELGLDGVVAVQEERCVALSDIEAGAKPWCKVEVRNVNVVSDLNRKLEGSERTLRAAGWKHPGRTAVVPIPYPAEGDEGKTIRLVRPPIVAENHLGFVERVMADAPGWFDAQTEKTVDDLTYLYFDVEQSNAEPLRFPDHEDPFISIAWEAWGPNVPEDLRQGILLLEEKDFEAERYQTGVGKMRLWDKRILTKFKEVWARIDPDVVAGFNVHGYDIGMMVKRAQAVGIGAQWLCRGGGFPRREVDKVGMWEKERMVLKGRVVYDVFERVFLDQSLNGKVKTRGLKDVARYKGLPVKEIDTTDALAEYRRDINEFIEYNKNDVVLARELGVGYWENFLTFASLMQAPLRHVVDGSANFFGTRVSAEDFQRASVWGCRVVSDGTNYKRFQHVSNHSSCPRGNNGKGGPVVVTGARVGIKKTGVFLPPKQDEPGTFKADVGAMYPSIIETFGLGPDNVVWIGVEQYGPFYARYVDGTPERGNVRAWREYHIPDHQWNVNHIIRVYGQGNLSKRITRAKAQRKDIKKRMKGLSKDDAAYKKLDSQQDALKVFNNSIFGNQANEYARYGNMAVAMTITGMGRMVGAIIEEALGDAAIETDTDGVYSSRRFDEATINKAIDDFVTERCLLAENTIKVEVDEYVASFFHSEKNYLLLEEGGKLIKHGSAIVGSKHCALWDEAVEVAAKELFGPAPVGSFTEWRKVTETELRAHKVPLARLKQFQKVDASTEYATNTQGKQIALSHVRVHGREPPKDMQVPYVYSKLGFEVAAAPGVEKRIDVGHYVDLLKEVETLFGLGKKFTAKTLLDFA